MTYRVEDTALERVFELLAEEGFDGMSQALEVLLNEMMKVERSRHLQAAPYERSEQRQGYANGFKAKRVRARVGELNLAMPQDARQRLLPQLPGEGKSERALRLALAEAYVQGVSTRKMDKLTQELCGIEVSSTEVSRAAQALDETLSAWRERPLGAMPYVYLDARYEKGRHGGQVVDSAALYWTSVSTAKASAVCWLCPSPCPSTRFTGASSCWPSKTAACTASSCSSRTLTRASRPLARRSSPRCRGSVASSTSSRMLRNMCPVRA